MKPASNIALLIMGGFLGAIGSFLWRISEPSVIAGWTTATSSAHQFVYGDDITTGSVPERQPKTAKKPPELDGIARAWRTTNYVLGLCWLDDHCRKHDQRTVR